MKNLSFILFVVVAFMACNNDEEPPIINDDTLIGTWSLNEDIKTYINDSLQSSSNADYTLEVQENVMIKTAFSSSSTHYWTRNSDRTIMFIITENQNSSGNVFANTHRMQIEQDEQNNQLWKEEFITQNSSGGEYKLVRTWTLER